MTAEIQKFDPSKLMDGDRIKSTFVSLIPDDQWDKLVQAEITRFLNLRKMDLVTTDLV